MDDPTEVSKLLDAVRTGDHSALDRLVSIVYAELKRLASSYMDRERSDHTLQTTALVHEAYLRLVGRREKDWQNRSHFFAIAAEAMRSILVDHARARLAAKRGAGAPEVPLEDSYAVVDSKPAELLAIDEALSRLALQDARQARIVELRYFAGMTVPEVAAALEISERTVMREWSVAKAWLHGEVRKSRNGP